MKKINGFSMSVLLALSFIFSAGMYPDTSYAKEAKTIEVSLKTKKFAIMVSDVMHFKLAVMTAEQMKVKEKKVSFEIIAVAELVKAMAEDPTLLAEFDKAEALGVKIVVCEAAMTFFKVPKEKMDKRLEFTANSWIYMYHLQENKYFTLVI